MVEIRQEFVDRASSIKEGFLWWATPKAAAFVERATAQALAEEYDRGQRELAEAAGKLVMEWRKEAALDEKEIGRKPETHIKIDLSWRELARRSRNCANQLEAILPKEEGDGEMEEGTLATVGALGTLGIDGNNKI